MKQLAVISDRLLRLEKTVRALRGLKVDHPSGRCHKPCRHSFEAHSGEGGRCTLCKCPGFTVPTPSDNMGRKKVKISISKGPQDVSTFKQAFYQVVSDAKRWQFQGRVAMQGRYYYRFRCSKTGQVKSFNEAKLLELVPNARSFMHKLENKEPIMPF